MRVQYLGCEDPLEEEMATHSSIFAREIQRTEEPGELVYGVTKSPTQLSTHTFLHAFTPEETVKESQV